MMAQQKNVWGKEREGEKEKADQKPGRSSGTTVLLYLHLIYGDGQAPYDKL